MRFDWAPLYAELRIWRDEARVLPIWWRDDDAIAQTDALYQLADLAAQTGVPIHVAVIPDRVAPSLPTALAEHPLLIPVVHGWRHISHAPEGHKNAEFGHPRVGGTEQLRSALTNMRNLFGADLIDLFVPPWNRIAPNFTNDLAALGYSGLSTYGARKQRIVAPNLTQINTHIDPIFWRGDRGLVDPTTLIDGIVATLKDRREGHADAAEPLGLLTHHLVHTPDVWAFSADVIRVLLDGGAVPADIRGALADTAKI